MVYGDGARRGWKAIEVNRLAQVEAVSGALVVLHQTPVCVLAVLPAEDSTHDVCDFVRT
jgi:hypothetical protein